ncbi:uncharacterized protein LOC121725933 isoform X2 [Aricia agestis]|uniref:uncharacterized protein LOC121725933 isoform X2 n=1 Tax=Aricia agestis TaxID=91739 RepID=UPI001C202A5E|nr:uncharacterized protein LOC121725933 isoform X2 [Aricia agestis]
MKPTILVLLALVAVSHGIEQSNYDISRKKVAGPQSGVNSLNYDLSRTGLNAARNGGGYGQGYPGGYYPGGYRPGNYPGGYRPPGPPGAHPNCPLCDSSVYDYCSYKQAHDSCCCENSGYGPFLCRMSDCRSIYANSCEEYYLISSCCCVDVQRNAMPIAVPVVA